MYRIWNHIPPDWGPVPEKSVYRGSGNIIFYWAPAPDEGGVPQAQATSSLIGPRSPIQKRLEAQAISSLIGPRPLMGGGAYRTSNHIVLDWGRRRGGVGCRNSDHIVWALLPDKEAYRSSSHIGPRLPMRWRIEAQTMSSLIGARSPIMGRSRIVSAFRRYLHGSCLSSRRTYSRGYTTEASTRHCSKGSTSTGDGTHNTIFKSVLGI